MFFHFFGMTRKNLSDAFVSFKTSFQTLRWRQSFSIISITRQQFHLQKMKLLIKKFTPFNTNLTFLTNIILNSCGNPIDKFHVTSLMGVTKRLLLGFFPTKVLIGDLSKALITNLPLQARFFSGNEKIIRMVYCTGNNLTLCTALKDNRV